MSLLGIARQLQAISYKTESTNIAANVMRCLTVHAQGLSLVGISVEDDVWIGAASRILDGVRIAKGTVVGSGAVVTRTTEPNSVVVGVPAKAISSRA